MTDEPKPAASPAESPRFFQSVDWVAFWFAFTLSLSVYLLTLAPANTLAYSGIFATDAMYPGPSMPPGHPLWAIYGWLYLIAASIPFACLRQLPAQPRHWMLGLLLVWFIMTLLMLVMLNFDRQTAPYMKAYFAATHLVLALLSGCGLMLVAAHCAKLVTRSPTRHSPAELQI